MVLTSVYSQHSSQSSPPNGVSVYAGRMNIGLIPKLLLSILLVFAVMVGGLVTAVYWTFEDDLSAYLRRVELEQVAPVATLIGERYAERGNWEFVRETPSGWHMLVTEAFGLPVRPGDDPPREVRAMIPRIAVTDMQGRLVIRPPFGGPPGLVGDEAVEMQRGPRQPRPQPRSETEMETWPINADGRQVGWLKMVPTPVPTQGINRQFREDRLRTFYLAAIPALLFSIIIALPLGFHFLRPLQRLTRSLHTLAGGNYSVRLPTGRKDEVGLLARDFNELAEALERAENMRREGMASISHELRTPLSTMIAEVEAMQDGIRPLNTTQLEHLGNSMEHLNRLVDDLYQLALADVGALVCDKGLIEWDEEINEVVESIRGKLEARGLELKVELEPHTKILGDPLRLRQVVLNLLENCWRYADVPGTVTVTLCSKNGQAVLKISDSGPGVSDTALETLFDRFSRGESSRNRGFGGAGLGMALVKAIVLAHNGNVTAVNEAGGLAVTIAIGKLEVKEI